MAVNPKSLENLKPAKPGEVRNPKGYTKGIPNTKTRLKRLLELEQLITNPVNGKQEMFTVAEQMDLAIIKEARKGSVQAYNAIIDRLEGKPGGDNNNIMQVNINSITEHHKDKYGI